MDKILKKIDKPSKIILIISAILLIYIALVVFPFFVFNQPLDESINEWRYTFSPIYYGLILFPAFVAYCIIVGKHIFDVQRIRKYVYPTVFITLFAAVHAVFLIYGIMMLWLLILSVPIGCAAFCAILYAAINLDKNDKEDETEQEDGNEEFPNDNKRIYAEDKGENKEEEDKENEKKVDILLLTQKITNIVSCIVLPLLLTLILIQQYFYITIDLPKKKADLTNESTLKCSNYKKAIQMAAKKLDVGYFSSYQEMAEAYKNEFEDYKFKYKPLITNYDSVKINTGNYYAKFSFAGKIKGGYLIFSTFTFIKEGECNKESKNCRWDTYPHKCSFYLSNDGKLYTAEELQD